MHFEDFASELKLCTTIQAGDKAQCDQGEDQGEEDEVVTKNNFRWRRWGSPFPGLRTLDPPLSPPWTPSEIYRHTCLPQPLRSHIRSFGTLGQLLKFSKKNLKKN